MGYPAGAVQVTGFIGTTSILDTYATHLDYLGFGGFRGVADILSRDAITTDRRVFGMVATTQDGNGSYILANLIMGGVDNNVSNNANWLPYATGGGGLISVTNAQMLLLISTNAVIPAQFYLITDAFNSDGGVAVQGLEIGSNTTLQGSGLFLNADYQTNGNYSGVVGFVSALGLWSTVISPVVIGDCVVYDNLNYVNLTGNWGSAPSTDLVNWQLLTKNLTNGYIREIDFVKYNVQSNQIIYRADRRGNEVEFSNTIPEALTLFQWGRNKARYNKISNQSFMVCMNSGCDIIGNTISNKSYIEDSSPTFEAGIISYNTVINGGYIKLLRNKGKVNYNTLDGDTSSIEYNGATNLIDTLVEIQYNFFKNGGFLKYDILSGVSRYYNNNIELGGFEVITQNGGDIDQINLSGYIFTLPLITPTGGLNSLSLNITGNGSIINIPILSSIISSCDVRSGFSNFTAELDFTDPAIWNGTDLTIPTDYLYYVGIFTIRNANPLTPVIKIINMPTNHPCRFTPIDTQQCGFQHTLVALSTPDDLLCDAPSSVNILTGRANGTDFIEYETSGRNLVRTNLVLLA
jgi:hypothetical protein